MVELRHVGGPPTLPSFARSGAARASYLESSNAAMRRVLDQVHEVAVTDTAVLLTGETGTGKEVVARHIHELSRRAKKPFVAINCGALPTQLIESELFGHERGAFSGAVERRIGHFEAADGGTLLLDEVSEIPLALQTRLLRVLQEREVQRVGSTRVQPLDVRVIATTNRDLRAMVERGELRKDLYYRLNVFPLALPPLRERREDIGALARTLIARLRPDGPATELAPDALQALAAYDFPGNIRELANLVERALVTSRGRLIDASMLGLEAPAGNDADERLEGRAHMALDDAERRVILETLVAFRGNRTHASRHLGICVRTLRNKLRAMRASGLTIPGPQAFETLSAAHGGDLR